MFFPGFTITKILRHNLSWLIMAALFFFAGAVLFYYLSPPDKLNELAGRQVSFLQELAELIIELPPLIGAMLIFINNLFTMLLMLIFGVVLGLFPLFTLILNGGVVGMLVSVTAYQGLPVFGMIVAGLLPHGIFELFALFLSGGLGLKFGYHCLVSPLPGHTRLESFKLIWKETITVLPLLVILLLLASLIEIIITPQLLGLVV